MDKFYRPAAEVEAFQWEELPRSPLWFRNRWSANDGAATEITNKAKPGDWVVRSPDDGLGLYPASVFRSTFVPGTLTSTHVDAAIRSTMEACGLHESTKAYRAMVELVARIRVVPQNDATTTKPDASISADLLERVASAITWADSNAYAADHYDDLARAAIKAAGCAVALQPDEVDARSAMVAVAEALGLQLPCTQAQIMAAITGRAHERTANRRIYDEALDERHQQDKKWGGPAHDDEHAARDWLDFIRKQECAAFFAVNHEPDPVKPQYRSRLVKILALSIAAIRSHDRKAVGQ